MSEPVLCAIPTRVLTICNEKGLHARPAAKLVECARDFDAEVTITKDGTAVSAGSILDLLMLAASHGQAIEVTAEGNDAQAALDAIEALVRSGFGESH